MTQISQHDTRPIRNVGIGLRSCHYRYILEQRPDVAWFEVLSDNYMVAGGSALAYLDAICEHYPVVMHGVGLSLGSTDPLDNAYLQKLKTLADRIQPAWISDHLCWISIQKHFLHDLLPLPYVEEVIDHVADRIKQVQTFLNKPVLIENVSSYFQYKESEMPEWDFINAIAERADCYILLDVNNVYVSSVNHNFDPNTFINNINPTRVKQFHMAGFADKGRYLFDTHGEMIHQPVWDLYQVALQRFGAVPTLIEWDSNIPKFTVLQDEARKAQNLMAEVVTEQCY